MYDTIPLKKGVIQLIKCNSFKTFRSIFMVLRLDCIRPQHSGDLQFSSCIYLFKQMEGLREVLRRVATFKRPYLYNKRVVDPYLLASHGFIISQEQQSQQVFAVRDREESTVKIELDKEGTEEYESIETALKDLEAQESLSHEKGTAITHLTFERLGLQIYEQSLANIKSQQKYIQLAPNEVREALSLPQQGEENPDSVSITFELFKRLDSHLTKGQILKVRSSVLLAVFGWQYSPTSDNQLTCQFCHATANVFEFISPSQCTLMNLSEGFGFISQHRPWCCLTNNSLWREILKQAVLSGLKNIKGQPSLTESQAKTKEVKGRAIKIYSKHQGAIFALKRRLENFKTLVSSSYEAESELGRDFGAAVAELESVWEKGRSQIEGIIRGIGEN